MTTIFAGMDAEIYQKLMDLSAKGNFDVTTIGDKLSNRIMALPKALALEMLDMASQEIETTNVDKISFLMGVIMAFETKHKDTKDVKSDADLKEETNGNTEQIETEYDKIDFSKRVGYDADRIQAFLNITGYSLEITPGQRRYGPPPDWQGEDPPQKNEIFCGGLPKNYYEDALVPAFSRFGKIFELRVMMDPQNNVGKGFCFVTYCESANADRVIKELNNSELIPGKKVNVDRPDCNTRLFLGNIPRSVTKEKIKADLSSQVEGIDDVLIYADAKDPTKKKNRGFCFVDFKTHKLATVAKRKLSFGGLTLWNCSVVVNWADKQEEYEDKECEKVKVAFIKNIAPGTEKEDIESVFGVYGKIENIRFTKDYCFVHFEDRSEMMKAIENLNGKTIKESVVEVTVANPYNAEKAKQKRMSREKEIRNANGRFENYDYNYSNQYDNNHSAYDFHRQDYSMDSYSRPQRPSFGRGVMGHARQRAPAPHYNRRTSGGPPLLRGYQGSTPNKRRMTMNPQQYNPGSYNNWNNDAQY
ncbi:RNA-binding motif protein 47 [Intoshia linei]|uniref:RNA-binding motif protein 47 n=1 Tax=Intoshia linei TaxID=1819745 RepID=A0A177BCH6_9BILA|nr:RNA-binding motif protein 47 [Intoshia linei]